MEGLISRIERAREKRRPPVVSAVIVAAGSSTRMAGIDKMLACLGELPVLVHSLYAFQNCPAVQEIVAVAREDLIPEVSRLVEAFDLNKVSRVVKGGSSRTRSVQCGLREIRQDADLAAIHDGARPLVTDRVIRDAVDQAAKSGAAAPAVPLTDTVKRMDRNVAVETLDRSVLRCVQTPQVFETSLIKVAIEKALQDGAELTDDCAAVERMGMKVVLTPGSRENIKITTPLDLVLGEAILTARNMGGVAE